ncbi:FAD-dependent oxidoreductase, partial [Rhodococcus sp. ENV425]
MGTVSVVGGGVIGLSIAWRAARAGWTVTVHDPSPGAGASWVAGGMLAPLSEGWPGEEHVLELGAASLARWPEFGAELLRETGLDLFTADASLTVALDAADAADLRTIAEWVSAQGHEMRVLGRAEVRELEPSLGPRIRLGLLAPDELAVDNRILVDALRRAVAEAGVAFVDVPVRDVADLDADRVVLA